MTLEIKPISLKSANDYVMKNHRHHGKVAGHKYSIACYDGEKLCGVAIVGRPLSRFLDDGLTLEVLRLCTDGEKNACSILYARAAKIAKDMGYSRIITYILETEHGSSLKASGWKIEADNVGGGSWENCTRREDDRIYHQGTIFLEEPKKYPTCKKTRWVKELGGKSDV